MYIYDHAFFIAPSFVWDASLLQTGIKIGLMHGIKKLNMMERMKRGGLCHVGSKRHVTKAHSQYLPDWNLNAQSNYSLYEDANNLYAYAMSEPFPYKNLKFEDNADLHITIKKKLDVIKPKLEAKQTEEPNDELVLPRLAALLGTTIGGIIFYDVIF